MFASIVYSGVFPKPIVSGAKEPETAPVILWEILV